ncbi:MAG: hypothetical protein PWQ44_824 [Methanolobus sp.]|nr:hypothetical protein [Methanolobus sp.]
MTEAFQALNPGSNPGRRTQLFFLEIKFAYNTLFFVLRAGSLHQMA